MCTVQRAALLLSRLLTVDVHFPNYIGKAKENCVKTLCTALELMPLLSVLGIRGAAVKALPGLAMGSTSLHTVIINSETEQVNMNPAKCITQPAAEMVKKQRPNLQVRGSWGW